MKKGIIQIKIIGPQGIGKTTLNDIIANALLDEGYEIEIGDEPLCAPSKAWSKKKPFVVITEHQK